MEGSDLARADRFLPVAAPSHREAVRREALRSTDDLVARVLESVDPDEDAVLVVAPYHRAAAVHLTVAALRAPDVEPGLLQSGSTRRAGLVTLVDIAPTILDLAGVERPSSMEGRRFERVGNGAATGEERAAYLAAIDEAARYRDDMVAPVAVTFVVLQAVLWIGAAVAIRRGAPGGLRAVALAALSLLAFLPATYLAGLIDFHAVAGHGLLGLRDRTGGGHRAPGHRARRSTAARSPAAGAWERCSGCWWSTCSWALRCS